MPVDARLWSSNPIGPPIRRARRSRPRRSKARRRPTATPQLREGLHDRAERNSITRRPGGRGGTRRPERRPISYRSRVECDHRGLRGGPRRRACPSAEAREQGRVSETRAASGSASPRPSSAARTAPTTACSGRTPYEAYRDAAVAAGRGPRCAQSRPTPRRRSACFGRCATRELEELTGRPRPVLEADLWALARE